MSQRVTPPHHHHRYQQRLGYPIDSRIDVVFIFNEGGALMAHLTIKTLFDTNRDEHVVIHIVTDGLTKASAQMFEQLGEHFSRQIIIHTITDEILANFDGQAFEDSPCSKATNFRLMIGMILPDLHRVLYLDSDMMIRHSLLPLWQTDLGDCVIAGVRELWPERLCRNLGYSPEQGYINAGMMLIDLDRWRSMGLDHILAKRIADNPARYTYRDQDVVNEALRGKIKFVDPRYNVTVAAYQFSHRHKELFAGQLELVKDPVIIHFTRFVKPWHAMEPGRFYLKRSAVERYIAMEPKTERLLNTPSPEDPYLVYVSKVRIAPPSWRTWRRYRLSLTPSNIWRHIREGFKKNCIKHHIYLKPEWGATFYDPFPEN